MGGIWRQAGVTGAAVILAEDAVGEHARPVDIRTGAIIGGDPVAVRDTARGVVFDCGDVGIAAPVTGAAHVRGDGIDGITTVFLHAPECFLDNETLLGAKKNLRDAGGQDQGDHQCDHQLDQAETLAAAI